MNSPTEGDRSGIQKVSSADTRNALLERSGRDFAPIYKGFIQNPDKKLVDRSGPLSSFVTNRDLRGLHSFCLLHSVISNGDGDNGWSTTLPISVWARAFGTTENAELRSASTAASKLLTRLEDRRLIARTRQGRQRDVTVTLLRPDGSGEEYTRPGRSNADRYVKLSNSFWTDGWYAELDLPATAMLLVAAHERPGFELVTERMPEWYGWSADTAERGLKTLRAKGLLAVDQRTKVAPLAPTGQTRVNQYTLLGPFAQTTKAPKRKTSRKTDKKRTVSGTTTSVAPAARRRRKKVQS